MYGERPSFHELMLITNYVFGSEPPEQDDHSPHLQISSQRENPSTFQPFGTVAPAERAVGFTPKKKRKSVDEG